MNAQEAEAGEKEVGGPFGNSPVSSHLLAPPPPCPGPSFKNAQVQEEISLTVGDAHTRGSAGDKGNL